MPEQQRPMRALVATVEILLDPRVIGPDAETEFGGDFAEAHASDFVSEMLSGVNGSTILDWRYVNREPTDPDAAHYWEELEIDPETYEEGSF